MVTIHATEYGRHQGWVDKHPQSYIHGVERWMANRADRLITCSSYMREHVADIYGLEESRVNVISNGIDPSELVPVDDLDTLRARFAAPDERLVLLVGRLVYEKGFQLALEALPGLIERAGQRPLSRRRLGHRARRSCANRPAGSASTTTAPSSAGSATTCCTRSTASPTSRWCPRSTSPSASWPSRPWRPAAPVSWPTRAGCARWYRTRTSGLRFRSRDPGSLATMAERLLTDEELRDRLVAEASEHVLSFDWADVARQVASVYSEVTRVPGASASARRAARSG